MKTSLISIGGRSTLISSVLGAIGAYYFSLFPMPISVNKKLESIRSNFFRGSDDSSRLIPWIAWNLALASTEKGGFGIGSLYLLNNALIRKWRWRFLNYPQALWARLMVFIHGMNDDVSFFGHVRNQGVWIRIVGSINTMHEKGYLPYSFMKKRVNNGASTKFWCDTWVGNAYLQQQNPRLFRLALNRDCIICDCWNNDCHLEWFCHISGGTNANHLASLYNQLSDLSLNDSKDTWTWTLGSSIFSVKSAHKHIDLSFLPDGGFATRWNCLLPKKINIFIWRVLRDRLTTRWNLSRKGVDVGSLYCPVCDCGSEKIHHALWICSLATTVWNRVLAWLDLPSPDIFNI